MLENWHKLTFMSVHEMFT